MKQLTIPPEFWRTLTDAEYMTVCETSELNKKLCKRLWAMHGLKHPPDKLIVMLNREDIMRLFPAKDKMQ